MGRRTPSKVKRSPPSSQSLGAPSATAGAAFELGQIYEAHFDFVWRSLRRLGVPSAQLDDAAHDVFLIVQRRLHEFEGRSSLKTWLFSITLRVAQNARRAAVRHPASELDEELPDSRAPAPDEATLQNQTLRLGLRLLGELDEDKRVVFILAELEELPASEIAVVLGVPLFTVYSRLRAARRAFEAALAREEARRSWRNRWTS